MVVRRGAAAGSVRGAPGVQEIQGLIDRLETMRRRVSQQPGVEEIERAMDRLEAMRHVLRLQQHRLAAFLERAAQSEARWRAARSTWAPEDGGSPGRIVEAAKRTVRKSIGNGPSTTGWARRGI